MLRARVWKLPVQSKDFAMDPVCAGCAVGMRPASFAFRMFAGSYRQNVIHATHPFVVVDSEEVCGSFSSLEAAEQFIMEKGNYSAFVLGHDGHNWVIAKDRLLNPLLHKSKPGHRRHRKI